MRSVSCVCTFKRALLTVGASPLFLKPQPSVSVWTSPLCGTLQSMPMCMLDTTVAPTLSCCG
eukprot:10267115-Karenia_brevis.AAC.1